MRSCSHITDNINEGRKIGLCDVLYNAGVAIINVARLRQGGYWGRLEREKNSETSP